MTALLEYLNLLHRLYAGTVSVAYLKDFLHYNRRKGYKLVSIISETHLIISGTHLNIPEDSPCFHYQIMLV